MADVEPLHIFSGVDEVAAAVGRPLGTTPWRIVDQSAVDTFADVTKDWQWLHCDPVAAAPFGGTILHGYLTVSLLSSFAAELYRVDGVASIINYGIDRLRFPGPVPVGARIRASGVITSVERKYSHTLLGVEYTVEVEGRERPGLVATTLIALTPEPPRKLNV